jgi:hypothetical protein
MDKKLILKNLKKDQVFDKSFGCLNLASASTFSYTIKEYEDLVNKKPVVPTSFTSQITPEKYKKLSDQSKKDYSVAVTKHNKLVDKYDADKKKYDKDLSALMQRLKDLNWCWQLVGKGVDHKTISHNETFDKGLGELKKDGTIGTNGIKSIDFPEFLEGGGMAWLEAFDSANPATAKSNRGVFVRALGTPEILGVTWCFLDTNGKLNLISKDKPIPFGATVQLHVYTKGLYGQNIDVQLMNDDWSDDKLPAFERKGGVSVDLKPEQKVPDMPYNTFFRRGVLVHEVKSGEIAPITAKTGNLLIDATNNTTSNKNIQKAVIPVYLDPFWKGKAFASGEEIILYAKIKHDKSEEFKSFESNTIKIKGNEIPSVLTPTGNKPLLQGEVETNAANFHPCQYTSIDFIWTKDEKEQVNHIYNQNEFSYDVNKMNLGIILGETRKKFTLKVDDKFNTTECDSIRGVSHKKAPVFIMGIKKNQTKPYGVKVIKQEEKSTEFEANFEYGGMTDIFKNYFFLTDNYAESNKFNRVKFIASTCRHQQDINITILPDIEWELAFLIATGPGLRFKSDKVTYKKLEADLGQYKFKGIKVEDTGDIIEKGSLGYSLVIKYSINSANHVNQISLEFIKNIERIIDTYNGIVEFLEFFKGKDDNGYSAAIETGAIKKITFDLDPPSIVFLLKWKYDYAKKNNQAVLCYTGAAGFKPLIGAKISVDLLQNLDKFGGLVGLVLGFLMDKIKKIAKVDLYIIVEVASKVDFDIGLSYNQIDGFDPGTKQTISAELTFSIKAGIKKKDVVFVTTTNSKAEDKISDMDKTEQESFKVEGVVSTGVNYKQENGYDRSKGKFTKTEIKWTGAEMTITVILMNNNRKVNAPPNYKEKFNILDKKTIYGPETTYQN